MGMDIGFKHKSKFIVEDRVDCERFRMVHGKKYCLRFRCNYSEKELTDMLDEGVDLGTFATSCPFGKNDILVLHETFASKVRLSKAGIPLCKEYHWNGRRWV